MKRITAIILAVLMALTIATVIAIGRMQSNR